jgi:hypothetical protein
VHDGIVRAFILESVEVNGVEAVAVDDAGNIFGGYTNTLNLRRWAPKAAPKSGRTLPDLRPSAPRHLQAAFA